MGARWHCCSSCESLHSFFLKGRFDEIGKRKKDHRVEGRREGGKRRGGGDAETRGKEGGGGGGGGITAALLCAFPTSTAEEVERCS